MGPWAVTETHSGESQGKREAEIGVMPLRAKESQALQAALELGEADAPSPGTLSGSSTLCTPQF